MNNKTITLVISKEIIIALWLLLCIFMNINSDESKSPKTTNNSPPIESTDWVSLGSKLVTSFKEIRKQSPEKLAPMMNRGKFKSVRGGVILAPMVSVDRTSGALYAFPQSGALFVSHDNGQTFNWLNREVTCWGFNESPTSLHVSPDGEKIRIFSSNLSGFSLDSGKTWSYMNFNIPFGFEDGHINWNTNSKTIIVRSHTWSKPRLWLSKDGGKTFNHFAKEVEKKVSSQAMAMLDDDVIVFQAPGNKGVYRTEDYCKTFTSIAKPNYSAGNKNINRSFKGVSRRFKDKVYWLNNIGVYTSADKGKNWNLIGNHFPQKYIKERDFIRSGPAFGKDEKHMIIMCKDQFLETTDGGKNWYNLAYAPKLFSHHPWSYSFAYDPISDIIYCNSRGHSGGPYLFARLALKRWGSTEKIPPTNPSEIKATITEFSNKVQISWIPSKDESKVIWYRIYVNDKLEYYTLKNECTVSDLSWGETANISIQSVDYWGNTSEKISIKIINNKKPENVVKLFDIKPSESISNNGKLKLLTKVEGKKTQPLSLMSSLLKPSAVSHYASIKAINAIGVKVNKSFSKGILTYQLNKKYKSLLLDIGLLKGVWGSSKKVTILVDKKIAGATKISKGYAGTPLTPFNINLSNAETLTFIFQSKKVRFFKDNIIVLNNALLVLKNE